MSLHYKPRVICNEFSKKSPRNLRVSGFSSPVWRRSPSETPALSLELLPNCAVRACNVWFDRRLLLNATRAAGWSPMLCWSLGQVSPGLSGPALVPCHDVAMAHTSSQDCFVSLHGFYLYFFHPITLSGHSGSIYLPAKPHLNCFYPERSRGSVSCLRID